VKIYSADSTDLPNVPILTEEIASYPTTTPAKTTGNNDPMLYIYTSGTTGLPKAAVLKHSRFLFAAYALYTMTLLHEDEVLYSPLPMYHTAAGALVTGNAMVGGMKMVTRKKFSARSFWNDCLTEGVTVRWEQLRRNRQSPTKQQKSVLTLACSSSRVTVP